MANVSVAGSVTKLTALQELLASHDKVKLTLAAGAEFFVNVH
jgi:hypothetical protein